MVIPSVLPQVGTHAVEFSLTLLPQERIPIWDEQSVMETWNNVVLLRKFIQVYTILNFVLYIIGKYVDNRLDIDEICSVGKTEILFLDTQQTKNIFTHTVEWIEDVFLYINFCNYKLKRFDLLSIYPNE